MQNKWLHKFTRDEGGTVLVFVSMCLAVVIGMCALTFDLGRVAATQSDLQSYVDHVALAAAGELDGTATAITRAEAAAADMIRDRQAFAEGGKTLGSVADYELHFLDGLPADDTASTVGFRLTASERTNNPETAQFVEVIATPRTVSLPFARSLANMLSRADPDELVGAVAVAGSRAYACDIAVLMFCMPPNPAILQPGVSVRLRSKGGGNAWGSGNYGFLDTLYYPVPTSSPCHDVKSESEKWTCMIATSGERRFCTNIYKGIKTTTGQRTGTGSSVFNTRFDMYDANMNKHQSDAVYAPSGHTVTGLQSAAGGGNDKENGNGKKDDDSSGGGDEGGSDNAGGNGQCMKSNTEASLDTMAFPPDDCIVAGTCDTDGDGTGDDTYGDGIWDNGRTTYVNLNYGDTPGQAGTDDPYDTATTRFAYYKQELQAAAGGQILSDRSETGVASCFTGSADTSINRRVFLVAGVDCVNNVVKGSTSNLPVETYYEVFLLRPVATGEGSSSKFDIDAEIIGPAGGFGSGNSKVSGIVRDVVMLVR